MKLRSLTIILMLMITIIGAAQKRKQTPRHKTQVSPEVAEIGRASCRERV